MSGDTLISGGKDATVRCHNTATGNLEWFFDGHTDYLNRIVVSGVPHFHVISFTCTKQPHDYQASTHFLQDEMARSGDGERLSY
jgi:hypothetical protein